MPSESSSSSFVVLTISLCASLSCGDTPRPPAASPPSQPTGAEPVAPVTTAPIDDDARSRPAHHSHPVPEPIRAIIDQPDRQPADLELDPGRHPAETLAFFGVRSGQRVAELGAGGGYTAELLARAVGKDGTVWGQNTKFILDRFAEKPWSTRLAKPVMSKVVRVDREFETPLPADATGLDVVVVILFYHDLFWMDVDRAAMNRTVHAALKPGGVYGIIDHSSEEGARDTVAKSLHRIDEELVRKEIEQAGFELVESAHFLRNPTDPRDWSASPSAAAERRGTSDRFVLKFRKPGADGSGGEPLAHRVEDLQAAIE